MSQKEKSKNDKAWESLFKEFKILEMINKNGYFEITSKQINKFRESRLMAKFDHAIKLPKIFRQNKLTILPISRYKYWIGDFDIYQKINYPDKLDLIPVEFPEDIESIDCTNLYSECAALNCAFNIRIIDDLVGEKMRCRSFLLMPSQQHGE
jgi:hypothetical protein